MKNYKYTKEELEVINGIQDALSTIDSAWNLINFTSDNDVISASIYSICAEEARYSYFLKKASELGIKTHYLKRERKI